MQRCILLACTKWLVGVRCKKIGCSTIKSCWTPPHWLKLSQCCYSTYRRVLCARIEYATALTILMHDFTVQLHFKASRCVARAKNFLDFSNWVDLRKTLCVKKVILNCGSKKFVFRSFATSLPCRLHDRSSNTDLLWISVTSPHWDWSCFKVFLVHFGKLRKTRFPKYRWLAEVLKRSEALFIEKLFILEKKTERVDLSSLQSFA